MSSSSLLLLSDQSSVSSLSRKAQQSEDNLPFKKRRRYTFDDESNRDSLSSNEAGLRLLASIVNLRHNIINDLSMKSKTSECSLKVEPEELFSYADRSNEEDNDPLTPLTPFGSIPNFPAKVYAILANPKFKGVAEWLPHGRSWRITNQKEFEKTVLPIFFDHANFSSFVRQANGWGFRRINKGKDKSSYYHEYFLRGLPHLCKKMTRPGRSAKAPMDPKGDPDLYMISEIHHLPENPITDESVLLLSTVEGGPKAKVPVNFGIVPPKGSASDIVSPAPVAEPLVITREMLDSLAAVENNSFCRLPAASQDMSSSPLLQSSVPVYQLCDSFQNFIPDQQQRQECAMNPFFQFVIPQEGIAKEPQHDSRLLSFVSLESL